VFTESLLAQIQSQFGFAARFISSVALETGAAENRADFAVEINRGGPQIQATGKDKKQNVNGTPHSNATPGKKALSCGESQEKDRLLTMHGTDFKAAKRYVKRV
jgi:hypothetical protein